MSLRNSIVNVFASPVTVVSALVIVTCLAVLLINISSSMSGTASNIGSVDLNNNRIKNESDSSEINTSVQTKITNSKTNGKYIQNQNDDTQSISSSDYNSVTGSRSGNSRNASNRNSVDRNRYTGNDEEGQRAHKINDDIVYQRSLQQSVAPSTTNNNASSLNFSVPDNNGEVSSNTIVAEPSINSSGSSNVSTNNVEKSESPITSSVASDDDVSVLYPVENEHTVQIDLDETQTVSCRPVVENGPPCMCTYTKTNELGSVSEVVNNCD